MAKILLNRNNFHITNEALADILEHFGVTCDRKRNGNIWVKSNERSWKDYSNVMDAVYAVFRKHGQPKFLEIDYDFFDHAGYYTADDDTTICVFCPYWGSKNWPPLIPYLWEKGYYVYMHRDTAFIRKRKEGDVMYTPDPAQAMFVRKDLDFEKYVIAKDNKRQDWEG